ncbi:hypothetical protein C2S51_026576 [Perilla frutescens var. frutescens]|nr:hypothetical protein C2S51_026576 [Perilla frutescens var. frutescens]
MKGGKRIDVVDAQLHFPEPIIQRVQSFLSRKQAASTAVLSKSWYNSWLTRPILDFDERDFQILPQNDEMFLNFANRSMERYRELGLGIESFKLWMNVRDIDSSSLATELIVKAVKLGANDVNLGLNPPLSEYLLPNELFGAKSLARLSAIGCRISGVEIMCSKLKLLYLDRVCVDDFMIRDIILGCPLLEELWLSHCEGFVEVNVGRMVQLKILRVLRHVTAPTRTKIPLIEFEEQSDRSVSGCRPNASEFSNLSDLLLERVKIDKILFCDFSNKFPCIRNLTVHYCNGCVEFDISSHSLKYISLAHTKKLEIQLDVPNICQFKFSGAVIPDLSFISASREWDSDISLACWNNLGVSWFLELKGLLIKLGLSKINLRIELLRENLVDCPPNVEDHCKPVVENLILSVHCLASATVALLDGVFWSFRPKIITQCLFPVMQDKRGKAKTEHLQPGYRQASNELLQLLCKKFMDLESSNCHNLNEKMHGLEGVIVEFFEDTLRKWQPLPWKTLADVFISSEEEVQVRFRLRWG